MKVAILCESPADRAAIRILIDGILRKKTQEISSLPHIEACPGGWPSVKTLLPTAIRYLYFNTDAEALVVIADSDDSSIHQSSHEQAGSEEPRCRLCQLRSVFKETVLRSVPGRSELKSAIGIAVPAIEAWYLCGKDDHVSEATWARKLQHSERIPYTRKSLKKTVYGAEHMTTDVKKRHAIKEAARLVNDLSRIETLFPSGFGSFARDVRNW